MKTQSHSMARVIRLSATESDEPGWLARSDGRGLVRSGPDRAAVQGIADTGSRPDTEPESEVGIFWSVLFGLMEGFALYGAALHPTAAMPVHAILAARKDLGPQPEDSEPEEPLRNSASAGPVSNGNVVKLDQVRPIEGQSTRRWHWLRVVAAKVAALFEYLRREHEIRAAVVALNDLDDRTLRDLGIRCRSEIEWTVRYCRDC